MVFQDDLLVGQNWEDTLFTACCEYVDFRKCSVAEQANTGGDFCSIPLSGESTFYIECKHDKKAGTTGNVFIETLVVYPGSINKPQREVPGWLYKLPSNGLVAWKLGEDNFAYLDNDVLLKVIASESLRSVNYTKTIPNSTGTLLPIAYLETCSFSQLVDAVIEATLAISVL